MRIALTGNPNSGKTTMYNALTGKNEHAGNWAGVTVAKKESPMKKELCNGQDFIAVDLPGAYSMSPFTSEESITSSYVKKENPDVIINIVDATNLSRSLFFTSQLLELGIPVVVALNKIDRAKEKDIKIDLYKLSKGLKCPVIATSGSQNTGLAELLTQVATVMGKGQDSPYTQGAIDLTNKEAVVEADKKRFEFVDGVVKVCEKRKGKTSDVNKQDALDKILADPIKGLPIFAIVMFFVFSISQAWIGPILADGLVGFLEGIQEGIGESMENASPFMASLLVDGIIGGFIAVVGFLPLIMVMFFLIALLEDCGYMARVAVVMDPYLKKVGLSGKSIIPMVIGTACAIPGVMASRTIRNERERRTTAMLTPFMPCGAKIPVIALFAGAFFEDAAWVSTLMYFSGIALIILGAFIIQKVTGHKQRPSFFIIELPEYKSPDFGRACISMLDRGKEFVIKAGTIILICNAAVHLMITFDMGLNEVEEGEEDTSILATISSPFATVFEPLGFGTWELASAAITGFIAKENVVGTLAVVYQMTDFIDDEELELVEDEDAGETVAETMGLSSVAALSYLMFNMFTPPCFAAIGAMNSEMRSKKWLLSGVGLQFAVGYVVAFFVYQGGSLLSGEGIGDGFALGAVIVAAIFGLLGYLIKNANKNLEAYALNGSSTNTTTSV